MPAVRAGTLRGSVRWAGRASHTPSACRAVLAAAASEESALAALRLRAAAAVAAVQVGVVESHVDSRWGSRRPVRRECLVSCFASSKTPGTKANVRTLHAAKNSLGLLRRGVATAYMPPHRVKCLCGGSRKPIDDVASTSRAARRDAGLSASASGDETLSQMMWERGAACAMPLMEQCRRQLLSGSG